MAELPWLVDLRKLRLGRLRHDSLFGCWRRVRWDRRSATVAAATQLLPSIVMTSMPALRSFVSR